MSTNGSSVSLHTCTFERWAPGSSYIELPSKMRPEYGKSCRNFSPIAFHPLQMNFTADGLKPGSTKISRRFITTVLTCRMKKLVRGRASQLLYISFNLLEGAYCRYDHAQQQFGNKANLMTSSTAWQQCKSEIWELTGTSLVCRKIAHRLSSSAP